MLSDSRKKLLFELKQLVYFRHSTSWSVSSLSLSLSFSFFLPLQEERSPKNRSPKLKDHHIAS